MQNYVNSGDTWTGEAPGDILSGQPQILGVQVGIAYGDYNEGQTDAVYSMKGVFTLPCSGDAFDVGQPLNYDEAGKTFYAGDAEVGDWANIAMSFEPGGDTIEECNIKINTHLSEFTEA